MNDPNILHRLQEGGHATPRVALKGTARRDAAERYELLGELARGGMGVVHYGHDHDLGRDVALKVLREDHLRSPDLIQRFVEEAQIGGQLQHPGIVPVYELGLQDDRRPFFAMKLIKGETLAKRLAERKDNASGRRGLLAVFRDVCRTMSYAHTRGVIHRDLKPSNLMIGGFGEVQVVDWGFAKVVQSGGIADEKLAKKAERDVTMIETVRSMEGSSASLAGSVMGTPAYMPPEQAMGRVDDLDERSDIFSLGAILCEILTGAPPYTGDAETMIRLAAKADLSFVYEALDACGADPRLVDLCRSCLEPLPKDRPSSAAVLADEVAAFLAEAEGRAHRAQVAALEAETEAEDQRRARRQTVLVASSAVAIVAIVAGLFLFISLDQAVRERSSRAAVAQELQDAARHKAEEKWSEALAAVERAIELGADESLLADARKEAAAATLLQQVVAEDEAFLKRLETIRSRHGQDVIRSDDSGPASDEDQARTQTDFATATDRAYETTFKDVFGSVSSSAPRLIDSRHASAFAANLGFWCWIRKVILKEPESKWREIDQLARRIDPSHEDVRAALMSGDVETLLDIAQSRGDALPPALVVLVGRALASQKGTLKAAVSFLERQCMRVPSDFQLQLSLARAASQLGDKDRFVQHAMAAVALRPGHAGAWVTLSASWHRRHNFSSAIPAALKATQLDPQSSMAWNNLGTNFVAHGDIEEGIKALDRALNLEPAHPFALYSLGRAYRKKGNERSNLDRAAAEFRKAIEAAPRYIAPYKGLGALQLFTRDFKSALHTLRIAVNLRPDSAWVQYNFGIALQGTGNFKDAERAYQKAIRLEPMFWMPYDNYGGMLTSNGEPERAIPLFKKAIQRRPKDGKEASTHFNLGLAYSRSGDSESAVQALKTSIGVDSSFARAHNLLGFVYHQNGDYEAAIESYETAISLKTGYSLAHRNLRLSRRHLALQPQLAQVIDGAEVAVAPADRILLGHMLHMKRHFALSAKMSEQAFREDSSLAENIAAQHRYNAACSAALADKNFHDLALRWLRADLQHYVALINSDPARTKGLLMHWKKDRDLETIRDAKNLPPGFRELWADVDALLKKM